MLNNLQDALQTAGIAVLHVLIRFLFLFPIYLLLYFMFEGSLPVMQEAIDLSLLMALALAYMYKVEEVRTLKEQGKNNALS